MKKIETTAFDQAQRYIGVREIAGEKDHPLIRWWLSLCSIQEAHDEIPWCSAFVNGIAWELRLPRSKSAAARSWLQVGAALHIAEAEPGFDVVVLKRGTGGQPGPDVIAAPGHVGFFAGLEHGQVLVLGGNQGDEVNVSPFPAERILGIRRLV
mgnify:CR=1 FL=1